MRIALALGSGGARGYAHIGAIEVLEERGFEIVAVAGSSMGAVVGGLHAAGQLEAFTEWVRTLTQLGVVRLLDPSFSAPGAIRAEKLLSRVSNLVEGVHIEELPIPFTAVATDLLARREVWFQEGPLAVAMRASIAIPGVVTPVMLNGRLLADGGLMNPVPIAPTTSARTDATIAVMLNGERRGQAPGAPARETSEVRPADEWRSRLRRGASQLRDRDLLRFVTSRFGGGREPGDPDSVGERDISERDISERDVGEGPAATEFGALPEALGRMDVVNLSLEVMQASLARFHLAGYTPDVLVTVPKDACRSLDFHRANELIELGRALTTEALDASGLDPLR